MSKTLALLVLSLVANGVLLALVAFPNRSAPTGEQHIPHEPLAVELDAPVDDDDATPSSADSRAKQPARADTRPRMWLDPLNELVTELRARRIDERAIRELAAAEAERLFRREARALLNPHGPSDYWKPTHHPLGFETLMSANTLKEFQRLRREAQATLRELIGEDEAIAPKDPNGVFALAAERPSYDYLPADKRLELIEYLELTAIDMYAAYGGMGARGDPRKMELEREEGVKQVLGPVLFEEYLKRSSSTANAMRQGLALFEPTQAEFDALVRIEWEARYERMALDGQATHPGKYQALDKRLNESIRGVLGDVRFEEYQRAADFAYQHLYRVARGRQLDAAAARAAFTHVEQARARVARISAGRDPSDAQLRAEVGTISEALQQRLAADLGLADLTEEERGRALAPIAHLWPGDQTMGMRRWRRF